MYKFTLSFWPNCEPLKILYPDSNYAAFGDHYRVMECIISLPIQNAGSLGARDWTAIPEAIIRFTLR